MNSEAGNEIWREKFEKWKASQTKFLANILVLLVFFMRFFAWPIFRLTH